MANDPFTGTGPVNPTDWTNAITGTEIARVSDEASSVSGSGKAYIFRNAVYTRAQKSIITLPLSTTTLVGPTTHNSGLDAAFQCVRASWFRALTTVFVDVVTGGGASETGVASFGATLGAGDNLSLESDNAGNYTVRVNGISDGTFSDTTLTTGTPGGTIQDEDPAHTFTFWDDGITDVALLVGQVTRQPRRHQQRSRLQSARVTAIPVITTAVGQPSETDSAQSVTSRKIKTIGLLTETDTAQPVNFQRGRIIGQAGESETAQPITHAKRQTLGQVQESDTAQPLGQQRIVAVLQASEADTAQPVTHRKIKELGQPSEADTAQSVTRFSNAIIPTVPSQQPVHRSLHRTRLQSASLTISLTISATIGQVSEIETAQPVTHRKIKALGQAQESDSAFSLGAKINVAVAQASETDTAQGVTHRKVKAIGQALEVDTSQPFTSLKRKTLGQVTETDVSQSMVRVKVVLVGQPSETDSAQSVGHLKRLAVGQAVELDTAQAITVTGGILTLRRYRFDFSGGYESRYHIAWED